MWIVPFPFNRKKGISPYVWIGGLCCSLLPEAGYIPFSLSEWAGYKETKSSPIITSNTYL